MRGDTKVARLQRLLLTALVGPRALMERPGCWYSLRSVAVQQVWGHVGAIQSPGVLNSFLEERLKKGSCSTLSEALLPRTRFSPAPHMTPERHTTTLPLPACSLART